MALASLGRPATRTGKGVLAVITLHDGSPLGNWNGAVQNPACSLLFWAG